MKEVENLLDLYKDSRLISNEVQQTFKTQNLDFEMLIGKATKNQVLHIDQETLYFDGTSSNFEGFLKKFSHNFKEVNQITVIEEQGSSYHKFRVDPYLDQSVIALFT